MSTPSQKWMGTLSYQLVQLCISVVVVVSVVLMLRDGCIIPENIIQHAEDGSAYYVANVYLNEDESLLRVTACKGFTDGKCIEGEVQLTCLPPMIGDTVIPITDNNNNAVFDGYMQCMGMDI